MVMVLLSDKSYKKLKLTDLFMSEYKPVSVILVTAGSRGDSLLFRYPYDTVQAECNIQEETARNWYTFPKVRERSVKRASFLSIKDGLLTGYPDKTLASILTPHPMLCGKKFELTIDNALFVGHPTLIYDDTASSKQNRAGTAGKEDVRMKLFNVVFVLQANASDSVINNFHDVSRRLAIGLKHEEFRCGYLFRERQKMVSVHDEVSSLPEGELLLSPFHYILMKSSLAQDLKNAFESICSYGTVRLKINSWVDISFCLPHKVHNMGELSALIKPDDILSSLAAMRPFHTMLMLVDAPQLLNSLPIDCSPALTRLIKMSNPLKSLQTLSQDTDIPLSQVFAVVAHLVYWGKAKIIYPLCESNAYVVAPDANVPINSPLVEKFVSQFPRSSLHAVLSEFSFPAPLSDHRNPLCLPHQQAEQVQMVVWLLQHRLLVQLHTYVFLVPTSKTEPPGFRHRFYNNARFSKVRWMFGSNDYINSELPRNPEHDENNLDSKPSEYESILKSLSYGEKQSVLGVPAASDPEDLKIFSRLCPYFQGRHHLEEIMYYENISRSQLLTLLDKFRQVLITCQHEDPATVYYV